MSLNNSDGRVEEMVGLLQDDIGARTVERMSSTGSWSRYVRVKVTSQWQWRGRFTKSMAVVWAVRVADWFAVQQRSVCGTQLGMLFFSSSADVSSPEKLIMWMAWQ